MATAARAIQRVNTALAAVVASACAVGLLFIVGSVVFNVGSRYLFGESHAMVGEASTSILLWMVFLGATLGYRERMFPAFTVLYDRIPDRLRRVVTAAVLVINLLAFAFLAVVGTMFALDSLGQRSPLLGLNRGYLYLALPVGATLLVLTTVERILLTVWDVDEAT